MLSLSPTTRTAARVIAARVGSALAVSGLAATLAVVPAAVRLLASTPRVCSALAGLSVLACNAFVPSLGCVLMLRAARPGARAFAARDSVLWLAGAVLWLALAFVALTALGTFLRATTHHHALAGATFGLGAVFLGTCVFLTVVRLGSMARRGSPAVRSTILFAGGAVLFLGVLLVAHKFSASLPASGPGATSGIWLVDVVALVVPAAFASRAEFTDERLLVWAGPVIGAALIAGGVWSLQTCPALPGVLADHAPLYSAIFSALYPWADTH